MRRQCFAIAALTFAAATLFAAVRLQEEMRVEGVLTAVDLDSRTLSIKIADDQEMNLNYSEETKIVGEDRGVQWLKERIGASVTINYRFLEEKPHAIQVEVGQQTN